MYRSTHSFTRPLHRMEAFLNKRAHGQIDGSSYTTFDKRMTIKPYHIYYPENLQDILNVLTDNPGQTIRVSGDNYTFNGISLTDDVILRTDKLDKIISLDKIRKQITVEAGTPIEKICKFLEEDKLALASVPENIAQNNIQTVGSACSTAAGGSDINSGTMSDQIVDMAVILGNGNVRRIELDDIEYPAFSTSLGALGIIYSITLRCVDIYTVVTKHKFGKWGVMKKQIRDFLDQNPLLQFSVNPNTLQTSLLLRKSVAPDDMPGDTVEEGDKDMVEKYYKLSLTNALLGSYTKTEVAIPYERIVEAMNDILKLCQSHRKTYGFTCDRDISVRFTSADYNTWLSPSSGRISAWIQVGLNIPLKNADKTDKFMQDLEDLLLYKYAGRPSWTTSKFINQYKAQLLYGLSLDYFRKIRERFDSQRIFTNEFMAKILD